MDLLRDVLRSSTKDREFAVQVRERLWARCETLKGVPLAEAVYAMSLSNRRAGRNREIRSEE